VGGRGHERRITLGFYDGAASPVQWRLADEFVLLDRYFQSVHGGSFANHYFLITAGIPTSGTIPDHARWPADGTITKDGEVSPDGYVVNNLDPPIHPQRLPTVMKRPLTQPTIGDRLDAKGVSWRWYGGLERRQRTPSRPGSCRTTIPPVRAARHGHAGRPRADPRRRRVFPAHCAIGTLPRWPSSSPMRRATRISAYRPSAPVTAGSARPCADHARPLLATHRRRDHVRRGRRWFDHVRPRRWTASAGHARAGAGRLAVRRAAALCATASYEHASDLKLIEWRFNSSRSPRAPRRRRVSRGVDFSQPPAHRRLP